MLHAKIWIDAMNRQVVADAIVFSKSLARRPPFAKAGQATMAQVASETIIVAEEGLSRVRTHSQKRTVAARAMAERKTVGHLS